MKRALIVTGSGAGTALLALLVAVALGGPALFVTSASIMFAFIPLVVLSGAVLLLTIAAATAWLSAFERGTRQSRFAFEFYSLAACLSATSVALLFGGDWPAVIAWGALGVILAEYLTTRHTRRHREARERAVKRIARRKEVAQANRKRVVTEATGPISTPWLLDVFDAPESTARSTMLAPLDANAAWALARLHRKGVPAEYVAARWRTGQPLDADALVASYRAGGAA